MPKSFSQKIGGIVKLVIALAILAIQVYPFLYVIIGSFKTLDDIQKKLPFELPSALYLGNYFKVLFSSRVQTYFKNSIIIMVVTLIILLALSSMAGFALSRINFKGRKFLLSYFLIGLMLPFQVALIPLFFIFTRLGILNTYTAVIIPQVAFSLSFSIYLFYSFYKFLPTDVIESGIIDGCTPMGIFLKLVMPMSSNAILTIATMQGVFSWNEFICANTFTRTTAMKTVTLGLNDFVGKYGLTDWGATFSMITITILPTFIFYFLTSKYMMSGLTAGAVKG